MAEAAEIEHAPAAHTAGEQRARTWSNKLAARILSLATLIGAVAVEWMLVNVPVSEVSGQFPATVRARDEIVTFTAPTSVAGGSFSFGYTPPTAAEKVLLSAFFDNAQLSDQTRSQLQSIGVSAPSSANPITYTTSGAGGSCATDLQVEPGGSNLKRVEFSQPPGDISSSYRALGVRFTGAYAMVTLTSQGELKSGISSCRVELKVGDWKQLTQGFIPIQIRVPQDAFFRFHWDKLDERSDTWKTKSTALSLLGFGSESRDEFATQAIAINSIDPKTGAPDDPPKLEAVGSKQSPLTVSYFQINQNQLEITASGQGRALQDGKLVRVNVLQRLDEYPIPSALLAAANLALIGWVKKAFFPARYNQSD